MTSAPATDTARGHEWLPWAAALARLLLGTVWIVAGAGKVTDLPASVRAVRAYQLLPEALAQVVGAGLPLAEIVLGVLLVLGLGVRAGAAVSAVLLAVFIVAIASVWGRGLRIDCGCFGSGGELAAGQRPRYVRELLRDTTLLIIAGALACLPASRLVLGRGGAARWPDRHAGGHG